MAQAGMQTATLAAHLSLAALPVSAENVQCDLVRHCGPTEVDCATSALSITFDIDLRQFAPPVNPGDPPRRKITQAQIGAARVAAEPFIMPDGTRGFWEDAGALGSRMLVSRPDGTARYSERPLNAVWTGHCEVSP